MDIASELMYGLDNKISFVIPIFGGIPVPESVVTTWGIMVFLMAMTLVFVRNLKVIPTGPQLYVEAIIGGLNNFFQGIMGDKGKRYFPYLGTVALYIGIANIIGIVGLTSPTKDLNVTAGLAIMSILLIEYSGIHARGGVGWLKSFIEPMPILLPINILEMFIRPLSLSMRLFGNILGSFVVMELIKFVVPAVIPVPFSFYFDIFDGFIQAYVFVFLTSLFMKEKIDD